MSLLENISFIFLDFLWKYSGLHLSLKSTFYATFLGAPILKTIL